MSLLSRLKIVLNHNTLNKRMSIISMVRDNGILYILFVILFVVERSLNGVRNFRNDLN